jgi:2-amino-4-hydroxy-6-hydroxymethyldihydropteridine diphosphokinase
LALLQALHQLEQCYGRQRRERWGPRSLDLDLLWWGALTHSAAALELPHPRWQQRSFVLAPLLAIEQCLGAPLWLPEVPERGCRLSVQALLTAASAADAPPQRLTPRLGWPE